MFFGLKIQTGLPGGLNDVANGLSFALEIKRAAAVPEAQVVRDVVMSATVAARRMIGRCRTHRNNLNRNPRIKHPLAFKHQRSAEFGLIVRVQRFHHLMRRVEPGFAGKRCRDLPGQLITQG